MSDSDIFRAAIPTSTDPARLEREAKRAEARARDAVIEECAKVADAWCEKNHWPNGAWGIGASIRALARHSEEKPPASESDAAVGDAAEAAL